MRNLSVPLLIAGVIATSSLTGCSSSPETANIKPVQCDIKNAPVWVCEQTTQVSQPTHFELVALKYDENLPYSIQEDQLIERGRSLIAASLSSDVKRETYQSEELLSDSLGSEYRQYSKSIDQKTSEVRLLRTRLYRRVVHSDGMFYGLVGMPKNEYDRTYKEIVKSLRGEVFAPIDTTFNQD
jgi:hypothetical protein